MASPGIDTNEFPHHESQVPFSSKDEKGNAVPPPGTSPEDAGLTPTGQPNMFKGPDKKYYQRNDDGSFKEVTKEEATSGAPTPAPEQPPPAPGGDTPQPGQEWDTNHNNKVDVGEKPPWSKVTYVADNFDGSAAPPPGTSPEDAGLKQVGEGSIFEAPNGQLFVLRPDGTWAGEGWTKNSKI